VVAVGAFDPIWKGFNANSVGAFSRCIPAFKEDEQALFVLSQMQLQF
jgi:hypothetical protein